MQSERLYLPDIFSSLASMVKVNYPLHLKMEISVDVNTICPLDQVNKTLGLALILSPLVMIMQFHFTSLLESMCIQSQNTTQSIVLQSVLLYSIWKHLSHGMSACNITVYMFTQALNHLHVHLRTYMTDTCSCTCYFCRSLQVIEQIPTLLRLYNQEDVINRGKPSLMASAVQHF